MKNCRARAIWISLFLVFTILYNRAISETYVNANGECYVYSIDYNSATLVSYSVLDVASTPETICIPASIDGYPVKKISENAFNCTVLLNGVPPYDREAAKTLILPEGIITLEENALYGTSGFHTIIWPSTLTDVYGDDLSVDGSIIIVSDSNPRFFSDNGFLIDVQENELLYAAQLSSEYPLPEVKSFAPLSLHYYQPERIVFPETTKTIGSYTCYDNTETLSIVIPGNVETIEDNAFYAMEATEIYLEDGVAYIGAYAFFDTMIEKLEIPKSVEFIGFGFCQDHVVLFGQPSHTCHWETEDEYEERVGYSRTKHH